MTGRVLKDVTKDTSTDGGDRIVWFDVHEYYSFYGIKPELDDFAGTVDIEDLGFTRRNHCVEQPQMDYRLGKVMQRLADMTTCLSSVDSAMYTVLLHQPSPMTEDDVISRRDLVTAAERLLDGTFIGDVDCCDHRTSLRYEAEDYIVINDSLGVYDADKDDPEAGERTILITRAPFRCIMREGDYYDMLAGTATVAECLHILHQNAMHTITGGDLFATIQFKQEVALQRFSWNGQPLSVHKTVFAEYMTVFHVVHDYQTKTATLYTSDGSYLPNCPVEAFAVIYDDSHILEDRMLPCASNVASGLSSQSLLQAEPRLANGRIVITLTRGVRVGVLPEEWRVVAKCSKPDGNGKLNEIIVRKHYNSDDCIVYGQRQAAPIGTCRYGGYRERHSNVINTLSLLQQTLLLPEDCVAACIADMPVLEI